MKLTESALKNPAGVAVGVALVLLAGILCLMQLPVQLFPNIDQPSLSVFTQWRAAAPKEVESEILEPQEEVLRGLPGVKHMEAWANPGGSWINLTFGLETDMQQTLIEVISRLNRLPPLPDDAERPVIQMSGGGDSNQTLSWFFVQKLPSNARDIESYAHYIEDVIKPKLEAVPGVSQVQVFTGAPEELQIIFDPFKAAQLGISIPGMASVVGSANDVTGGFVNSGRRQYTVRFSGRYTPTQLNEQILEWRDGKPIRLGDIAEVKIARGARNNFTYQNGNPALGIQISRENGANVLEALDRVKAVVEELRPTLNAQGLDIRQSFDAGIFIKRAISLVTESLFFGVMLAIGVIWWFVRQWRATLIICISIPISLLAVFVFLRATGHNLNVISLAGLAFSVGLVTDASIIVIENIVRLRGEGRTLLEACYQGAAEVWTALLAGTATTVAIFLPVVFLPDVEGQLFADLALTIAISVGLSLFVAMLVLPVVSRFGLKADRIHDPYGHVWDRLTRRLMAMTDTPRRRAIWIVATLLLPFTATFLLAPKIDYLPPVKRDAVDGFFNFPPGANVQVLDKEVAQVIVKRLKPYMDGVKQPALKNYYIIFWPGGGTIGVRVKDEKRIGEMLDIVRKDIVSGLPDTNVFAIQGALFGGFGENGGVQIHLQSKDSAGLTRAAREGIALVQKALPKAVVRPTPALELAVPELRLNPNDARIAEAGWNRRTLGQVVRALGDGLYVGEYFNGDTRMDIILRTAGWENPEELSAIPLATGNGAVVPLGQLLDVERTVGPSNIRRFDGRRTMSLEISPPEGMSLEEVMQILQTQVEPKLRAALPPDGAILYGGSADSLHSAIENMLKIFAYAVVILFLLMAAIFKSVKDSFLVILTLPQATVGGVIAVRLTNLVTFQTMDLITMIGFIILLGLVVNNAILLVEQTRDGERGGLSRKEAVARALRLRMRPIFISTITNLIGTLPLLVNPGEGSQIYRGLAAAIVGGLSVSTIFTLILLPCLLRLGERERVPQLAPAPVDAGKASALSKAA